VILHYLAIGQFLCNEFILTEKTLLFEQCQRSLAMPGNKPGEYWSIGELEYWNKNRRF
jgi:hypothetical protein